MSYSSPRILGNMVGFFIFLMVFITLSLGYLELSQFEVTDFGDKTSIVLALCRLFWYTNDDKSSHRCKETSLFPFTESPYFFFIVTSNMWMGLNRTGRCSAVGSLDSPCLMTSFGKFGWRISFFNFLLLKSPSVFSLLAYFPSKYLWADLLLGIMVNSSLGYSSVRLVIYSGLGGWSASLQGSGLT